MDWTFSGFSDFIFEKIIWFSSLESDPVRQFFGLVRFWRSFSIIVLKDIALMSFSGAPTWAVPRLFFFHNIFQYAGKSFEKRSLEKKSGQRVFCGNNKKVSAKGFLEADDINKKKVSVWWNSPDV